MDQYGQRVTYDNSTSSYISINDGTTVEGTLEQTSNNGVIEFRELIITKSPDEHIIMNIDVDLYSMVDQPVKSNKQIPLHLEHCKLGEILTPSGGCFKCEENKYTFQAGGNTCNVCPDGAICEGGKDVYPRENYWRMYNNSD